MSYYYDRRQAAAITAAACLCLAKWAALLHLQHKAAKMGLGMCRTHAQQLPIALPYWDVPTLWPWVG